MNKLVIAAFMGLTLSFTMAMGLIVLTSYYFHSRFYHLYVDHKYFLNNPPPSPVIMINNYSGRFNTTYMPLVSSMKNVTNGTYYWGIAYNGSILNSSLSNVTYYTVNVPEEGMTNVFYVQPNFIETKPNTTVSFILYFNYAYYKLYGDSVYSDEINGYLYGFQVIPLNQTSPNGFIEYKITLHIGNVKPNTLILLPIWDTRGFEVEYVIILVE